jgi:SAM-dependent methyltransferase
MKECSKSIQRRLSDPNFISRYFVGRGLDIGGKPDPLGLYAELFCRIESVKVWDWEDGDAQYLADVADGAYDFVHSSHCLEHLRDPREGIGNWFRVVKPEGYLIITVPDEDLYEQGVFPSTFNRDHKWTFSVNKSRSWSDRSINVLDLVRDLGPVADLVKLELLVSTYRFSLPRYDQTSSPVGECGIEFVIRKRAARELETGGQLRDTVKQPSREMRLHYNQYRDDWAALKSLNTGKAPFENDNEL